MSDELLARLAVEPDREGFLVLGDALQAAGDVRGELVVVQTLLEDGEDTALRARERELLAKHRPALLGDLAALPARDVTIAWRNGYPRAVHLGPPIVSHAYAVISFADAVARLARMPGGELVREVSFGAVDRDEGWPRTWQRGIDAIAQHGLPPNVEALTFHRGHAYGMRETRLGDLSVAYGKLARLKRLTIALGGLELGALALPALRELRVITSGLTAANLAALAAVRSHVETLELCVGVSGDNGCDVTLDDMRELLEPPWPALVDLGLCNTDLSNALAWLLVQSPLLPRLTRLDLSRGTLSDDGAEDLLADAPLLAHLDELDLSHAYLSPPVRAAVAGLCRRVLLADPQSPDDDYRVPAVMD